MSRIEEIEALVQAFWEENDVQVQATQLRKIGLKGFDYFDKGSPGHPILE